MKHLMLAVALTTAFPISAQTSNDDMPAIENWWDKVGADFFGPATMQEPRPENEIRAQWTGLSADDQAAVIARCAASNGQPALTASLQEGSADEGEKATSANDLADTPAATPAAGSDAAENTTNQATTTTGSVDGSEVQASAADESAAPDTGLAGRAAGSDTKMALICDLVPDL